MKHDRPSFPLLGTSVEFPTPTAWPIVTAFGLTLVFAGLVTDLVITLAGVVVGLVGAVGWCFDLFPHPKHEPVPLRPKSEHPEPIRTTGRVVRILDVGKIHHRARIPVEVPSLYGGGFWRHRRCGGDGRAGVPVWHFQVRQHLVSNQLLAAAGVPELAEASLETLRQFSFTGLVVGSIAHISISILVGLLYVVLLPMLPARFEWLWGGIVTPADLDGADFCLVARDQSQACDRD